MAAKVLNTTGKTLPGKNSGYSGEDLTLRVDVFGRRVEEFTRVCVHGI